MGSVLAKATVRPSAVSGPPDSLSPLDPEDMDGPQDQAEDERHFPSLPWGLCDSSLEQEGFSLQLR